MICQLCPVVCSTLRDYLKHVQLFHAHQSGFNITCSIGGCQRTFKNFGTFRNHVSDCHSSDPNPTTLYVGPPEQPFDQLTIDKSDSEAEYEDESIEVEQPDISSTLSILQRNSVLFLMGLKEERKLTQTALQGGVTSLMQTHLDAMRTQVCGALTAAGIPSTVPGLEEAFDQDGALEDVSHLPDDYCQDDTPIRL